MQEKISPSEWKVMEILWQQPGALAAEIVEALEETAWQEKTIKTLINRLVKKGNVRFEKDGKAYRYFPVTEREVIRAKESQDFIQRIFGGSVKAFMTNMIKAEALSEEEISDLKRLLDRGKD
ncbi:BlaI/MecI/CopY family transcriptional regulator [Vallitaleaceae bacterium 9-2]